MSPSEVEEALKAFPGVADVAVVGLPSTHSGEEVVAAVVLEPGTQLDESAIRGFARENLTAYKVPRHVVAMEELPKSLIGKTLRRVVRERLINEIDAGTGFDPN